MATHAPITGAPTRATISTDLLNDLEALNGTVDNLGAVIRAAGEQLGPSADPETTRLLHSAEFMHEHIGKEFAALVERMYAERREAEGR